MVWPKNDERSSDAMTCDDMASTNSAVAPAINPYRVNSTTGSVADAIASGNCTSGSVNDAEAETDENGDRQHRGLPLTRREHPQEE